MSNYATKADLKGATEVNTSNLPSKSALSKLKFEVDKIDINKLKTVPVDLSKLSNVVNNEVVMKTMFDKLVATFNAIDGSGFVSKAKYDTDKSDLEKKINNTDKKIPNIGGFVEKQIITQKWMR